VAKRKRKPRPRTPDEGTSQETDQTEKVEKVASTALRQRPKKEVAPPPPPMDPYPSLRVTMARSFAAATAGPLVVFAPMVVVALLWVVLLGFGMQVFPSSMVQSMAVPPISSLFDFSTSASLFGATSLMFVFLLGMTVVRAAFLALFVGMLDEGLEYGSVSMLGVLKGVRAFWGVLMFCYLEIGVALIATLLLPQVLGPQIANTVSQVALLAGLYFLGFTPAVAVRLGVPAREAVARSIRGARMPGWPRHLLLVVICYFLSLMFGLTYPGGGLITANPTLGGWLDVLASVFVYMVFLAAFIDRWKAVEPYVPSQARSRPTRKPPGKR